MKKFELTSAVDSNMNETKEAIETILAELNKGQRQKILRNEKVKALCERYGIEQDT